MRIAGGRSRNDLERHRMDRHGLPSSSLQSFIFLKFFFTYLTNSLQQNVHSIRWRCIRSSLGCLRYWLYGFAIVDCLLRDCDRIPDNL